MAATHHKPREHETMNTGDHDESATASGRPTARPRIPSAKPKIRPNKQQDSLLGALGNDMAKRRHRRCKWASWWRL